MEIHGTVYYESQRPPEVPAFVKNHGLLPQPEFQQLLRKAKVSPPLPLPSWPCVPSTCGLAQPALLVGRAHAYVRARDGEREPLRSEPPGHVPWQPWVGSEPCQQHPWESAPERSWHVRC